MHLIDARQRNQIARLGTRQRPQTGLAQHAIARLVARSGLALTPGGQHLEHGQLLRLEAPGLLDLSIGLLRVGFALQVGDQLGTVLQHPGSLVVRQLRQQRFVEFGQVLRILGGVAHLHLAQRPLQPVRARFALGQFDAKHGLDQPRIAHGKADVQVAGGQLGIEQRLRQAAGQAQQHFEVLAAGMQHLYHSSIVQQCGKRMPIAHRQRVDQIGAPPVTDLHQPGDGIKGVHPHEFGVHRHKWQLAPFGAEAGQMCIIHDPLSFDGHTASFSADDRRAAERGAQYISSIRPAGHSWPARTLVVFSDVSPEAYDATCTTHHSRATGPAPGRSRAAHSRLPLRPGRFHLRRAQLPPGPCSRRPVRRPGEGPIRRGHPWGHRPAPTAGSGAAGSALSPMGPR